MNLDEILTVGATVVGWVIFACVCSYAIPQFVRIIKTKNTSAMSVIAYVAFMISSSFMASWGIGNAIRSIQEHPDWKMWSIVSLIPNILTNVLNTTINLISLIIKVRHLKMCKQYNINEVQLAKRLVKAKKGSK